MRDYFYSLLRRYISLFVLSSNSIIEVDPINSELAARFPNGRALYRNRYGAADQLPEQQNVTPDELKSNPADFILLSGRIHYERDVQGLLSEVWKLCGSETRLIVTYYSSLWKPLASLAASLKLRRRMPETNWLAHEDVLNLLHLENFELVHADQKVLFPLYIPLLSEFVNRFVAPLPIFRNFCLVNIAIARPRDKRPLQNPSVTIVVPARNEAGNIESIVQRVPRMGSDDEIIFVEGNSTDSTWERIRDIANRYSHIRAVRQTGKGKGDAVRTGFALAKNEVLMILDADMTVPPEDLPKFYSAITEDKGEFINGSRLVYPMEKKAMRFFNLVGNKFFALAFSFVLGQRYKDTLCGTKVLSKTNYVRLQSNRSYFGDFDPFGDFDLIFGAARMGLKIVEIPISYRERIYGETNISRWRHGAILVAMLAFAAKKIKFL
jgi:hypothetical protein